MLRACNYSGRDETLLSVAISVSRLYLAGLGNARLACWDNTILGCGIFAWPDKCVAMCMGCNGTWLAAKHGRVARSHTRST